MRTKSSASKKPRGIRVASKMPEIEFDMKAIREIKERKKKMRKRFLKRSKKGGV
jgi:hypothetical protein